MAVFSIQRCNTNDEQIILDAKNGVLRVYGRQSSISAPLHTAVLQLVKRGDSEGGILSFGLGGFCGNVALSLAEYIQAFHYFNEIKKSLLEVKPC